MEFKISDTGWFCLKDARGNWIPATKLDANQIVDIKDTQSILGFTKAVSLQTPAYYDAEGGSMSNGIGRSFD